MTADPTALGRDKNQTSVSKRIVIGTAAIDWRIDPTSDQQLLVPLKMELDVVRTFIDWSCG